MLRHDGDYVFYRIEEHQSIYNRWVLLRFVWLHEYEFGQQTACGDCWQRTGEHGIFDYAYAKEYCCKLNEALKDGRLAAISEDAKEEIERIGIDAFRVVRVEMSQHVTPVEYEDWLDSVVKEDVVS